MKLKEHSSNQKLRGAYYTPLDLASQIIKKFCTEEYSEILEPSCGDGVFLEALDDDGYLTKEVNISCVEIDKDALCVAKHQFSHLHNVNFINSDFFDFYQSTTPASFDLILGNPPYIRYQYLEAHQRDLLSKLLESQNMKANKLINAWVGFMVACTNLLKPGGALTFVVPAEILQVVYAKDLRHFLSTHYSKITLLSFSKLVFEEAEQEVVVFYGIKGIQPGCIRVIETEDIESLSKLNVSEYDYQPLSQVDEKWTKYFLSSDEAKLLSSLNRDTRLVDFSDLGLVNVGITTGNNSYFSLTDEISNSYDLNKYTFPLIGRSAHAAGVYFTKEDWARNCMQGKRSRLLVLKDGQYDSLNKLQQTYIDLGVDSGANTGYKCSIRPSWYAVPSVWVPDAFFLRRNNLFPKFVLNDCNAVSTDTMHRIKFKPGIDPKLALLSYYNSVSFAYTEVCGRSYGGGVLEILPKEVSSMRVPKIPSGLIPSDKINSLIDSIDVCLRKNQKIEDLLDYIDEELLVKELGFTLKDCTACRTIWKKLQSRRLNRG